MLYQYLMVKNEFSILNFSYKNVTILSQDGNLEIYIIGLQYT